MTTTSTAVSCRSLRRPTPGLPAIFTNGMRRHLIPHRPPAVARCALCTTAVAGPPYRNSGTRTQTHRRARSVCTSTSATSRACSARSSTRRSEKSSTESSSPSRTQTVIGRHSRRLQQPEPPDPARGQSQTTAQPGVQANSKNSSPRLSNQNRSVFGENRSAFAATDQHRYGLRDVPWPVAGPVRPRDVCYGPDARAGSKPGTLRTAVHASCPTQRCRSGSGHRGVNRRRHHLDQPQRRAPHDAAAPDSHTARHGRQRRAPGPAPRSSPRAA